MTDYAERRVLSILLASPGLLPEANLEVDDFAVQYHRLIFQAIAEKKTGDILALGLPGDVGRFALGLDEDWAPKNLGALVALVKQAAEQRRFVASTGRLK